MTGVGISVKVAVGTAVGVGLAYFAYGALKGSGSKHDKAIAQQSGSNGNVITEYRGTVIGKYPKFRIA